MTTSTMSFPNLLKSDWERGYDDAIRGSGLGGLKPIPDLRLAYGSGYRAATKEKEQAAA